MSKNTIKLLDKYKVYWASKKEMVVLIFKKMKNMRL